MNYYNPYFIMPPTMPTSGISSLFGKINFSNILNGAQRTLGLFNQALPLIKEAAPMMRNAKTMFKVMNEFKKIDTPSNNNHVEKKIERTYKTNHNVNNSNPTFFL